MAYRSTITLTDKDQELFDKFKKELGIKSSSQAIATALRIAEFIRENSEDGKQVMVKDCESGETERINFVT